MDIKYRSKSRYKSMQNGHHVEGEAHHVLPPPDRGDDHQVAEDAEHGQAHVQHHHQGS